MATREFKQLRAQALRATRTDRCGRVVLGPDSVVASDGFVSVGLTANTEAGTAIQMTNAAGRLCLNDQPTPKFLNYALAFAFCGTNPALLSMLSGQPVVLDAAGENIVGFRQNSKVDVDGVGFALELWTDIFTDVCAEGVSAEYGYSLLPFIKGGVIGDVTFENGAVNFTVTGATTRDGSQWGAGPFDVTLDESDNPGPLNEVIDPGDHLHTEIVAVAPPSLTVVGFQALGTPATGATAGTPGTWTPANSYAPKNLAELVAGDTGDHGVDVVASPATAWTAGQSVVLRDGTRAHWDGDSWEAGPA